MKAGHGVIVARGLKNRPRACGSRRFCDRRGASQLDTLAALGLALQSGLVPHRSTAGSLFLQTSSHDAAFGTRPSSVDAVYLCRPVSTIYFSPSLITPKPLACAGGWCAGSSRGRPDGPHPTRVGAALLSDGQLLQEQSGVAAVQ